MAEIKDPIDFVVTWVDGSDPKWQKEKQLYNQSQRGDSPNRYRDWGLLKYWFRGVEQFAPWVHKIYFVTYGHLPEWLDTANPKLVIVNHKDYIPEQYLPTFNSHPIELNLHRIQGLSRQFVYFNDDNFLTDYVNPEIFFEHGLPKDACIESAVMQDDYEDLFAHILLNTCSLINMHYDKHAVIRKNWRKWFSPKYGKDVLRNFLMYPYKEFASFKFYHQPNAYLKDTFEAVWKMEPDVLDAVCQHKFRDMTDVNQYIMRYYQYVNGSFLPGNPRTGRFFMPVRDDFQEIFDSIREKRYKMICVNDDVREEDLETLIQGLKESFEILLPDKSSFEK